MSDFRDFRDLHEYPQLIFSFKGVNETALSHFSRNHTLKLQSQS